MNYQAKNYDHLLGTPGFSDTLLKNHFILYQGYVMNANKLNSMLDEMLKADKTTAPEYAELTRRFGWEFNGMRLHEYYFDNLTREPQTFLPGASPIDPNAQKASSQTDSYSQKNESVNLSSQKILNSDSLAKKISSEFGSFELWEKDFRAVAAMRGIGWAILAYDRVGDRLFNVWINEHDVGHLAGAAPLLVLDVFEHAYMLDYGVKRADYIAAFMKVINWSEVNRRFE